MLADFIAKIAKYDDTGADKATLLSALVGIVTGYTDDKARAALLQNLTGKIVKYEDSGAEVPKPKITVSVDYEYSSAYEKEAANVLTEAQAFLNEAFGGAPLGSALFNRIIRAKEASSTSMVSYYMQYYDRYAPKGQSEAWNQVIADLEKQYDFSKVLEGKFNPLARNQWSKIYAAHDLLFGSASKNPEAYLYDPVKRAEADVDSYTGFFDAIIDDTKGKIQRAAEAND